MKEKEVEKSYEEGWFGRVKIRKKEIKYLKDIADWLEDMCDLATNGSKRYFFGIVKKSEKKGMLGVLNICNTEKNKTLLKKMKKNEINNRLLYDIRSLLFEVENAMKEAKRGRTKQEGFMWTLGMAQAYVDTLITDCANLTKEELIQANKYITTISAALSNVKRIEGEKKFYAALEGLAISCADAGKYSITMGQLLVKLENVNKTIGKTEDTVSDLIKNGKTLEDKKSSLEVATATLEKIKDSFTMMLKLLLRVGMIKGVTGAEDAIKTFAKTLEKIRTAIDAKKVEIEKKLKKQYAVPVIEKVN